MMDECILCHHKLNKHKVTTYDEKRSIRIEYFIKCSNDDGIEGYKHCDCSLGFEPVSYEFKAERIKK